MVLGVPLVLGLRTRMWDPYVYVVFWAPVCCMTKGLRAHHCQAGLQQVRLEEVLTWGICNEPFKKTSLDPKDGPRVPSRRSLMASNRLCQLGLAPLDRARNP